MTLRRAVADRIRSSRTLHHYALRCYEWAHPPPHRRVNMEFEADAWNGISSLRYRGGRMLGEDNSGPYPYREITGNRYEACPFADGRLGLPMNVTNLERVLPYAADAYRLTTVLRNRHLADRGLPDSRFDLWQGYLFSKFSTSLPAFLARRRDRPVRDGDIEPLETAFYMLGAAPFILVRQLIARGDPAVLAAGPMGGDVLYALSVASRTLISNRECACPAAPKLIAGYFDVIMNGSYRGSLVSAAVERVQERIGDWRRLSDYNLAASRIDILVLLSRAIALQWLRGLRGDEARRAADLVRALGSALLGPLTLSHVGSPPPAEPVLELAVSAFSALLREHGDVPIADELAAIAPRPAGGSAAWSAAEAACRIREAASVVHRGCRRDLQAVHEALGTRRWPAVTLDDVLTRTGGRNLVALMGSQA